MNDYRVDKQEVSVELFLSDRIVRRGVVFLSPFASTHIGPETPLDLLQDREPFLPFRDSEGGFTLVNKKSITHLRYQGGVQEVSALGTKIAVRITFFGGELLEGTLILDMPEGKNRLQDYINDSPGFFALMGSDARYIANGHLVREISPR